MRYRRVGLEVHVKKNGEWRLLKRHISELQAKYQLLALQKNVGVHTSKKVRRQKHLYDR